LEVGAEGQSEKRILALKLSLRGLTSSGSLHQAAMSLQKNFPKNRAYYFWAIFLTHMVAVDDESSEAEKKLFGTLSYRMISKAGADVPAEPVRLIH
jgi:N-terminal acetyltransferase B complex non-catalytic subunit